ncbi:MAG: ABC transporter permease, partial [Marinoscillum sp.]
MNNIGLIIAREYLSRVRKKSFIIMTLLAPVLFGGFFFFIAWSATREADSKSIIVIDEGQMFAEVFDSSDDADFVYSSFSLDEAKEKVIAGDYDGVLFIPQLSVDNPQGVSFYGTNNPSITMVRGLSRRLEGELENIKLRKSGISKDVLESLKADVDISTINLSESGDEKASSSIGATGVGYVAAFMIYMFIFIYGAMCMRGVVE